MELDKNSAEQRLNSPNNLANRFGKKRDPGIIANSDDMRILDANIEASVKEVMIGKSASSRKSGEHNKTYSPEVKTEVAVLARANTETNTAIAAAYGMDRHLVGKIKAGKDKDVKEDVVKQRLNGIRDVALERLMSTLNLIDDSKLADCKAVDLASIASKLSSVVATSQNEQREQNDRGATLVVYVPEVKSEKAYNMVEIVA
jgi:hypothetical protein